MMKLKIAIPFFLVLLLTGTSCMALQQRQNFVDQLVSHFEPKALPLNSPNDLDPLIEAAAGHKLVLLGEASHGTSEFYAWRSTISRRLITEHGFSFIAVEGDWASLYRLNKYVKHLENAPASAVEAMHQFSRWPEWMWGNTDVAELIEWMREYNSDRSPEAMIGFYGMDVYGQWEAMDDLLAYAELYIPEHYEAIAAKVQCFANFDRDEWMYARATAQMNYSCKREMEQLVSLLASLRSTLEQDNEAAYFRAKQNALVVKNAEDYFRLAVLGNNDAWNSRVDHMWLSVKRLFGLYGRDSKGVVWAHNTHVGDASATSMGQHGMYNIGHLSRHEMGEDKVFITGFGTYQGKVNAGSQWGTPMQIMEVPNAIQGSLEHAFMQFDKADFLLVFDDDDRHATFLQQAIGHRAIGVVYNPANEAGNYVPSQFTKRYDAFIFIRETTALTTVASD
jgi:erythromycin esterase